MSQHAILLVDDEERFISTTSKILERLGHNVHQATRGREAIELMESHDIKVVIMDVKMPGMSGLETLATIKQRWPLVEIIMITGHMSKEDATECLRLGAFDFLLKPIDISELITVTDEAFNKQKNLEEKLRLASIDPTRKTGNPTRED